MSRNRFLVALLVLPLSIASFVFGQALSERGTAKSQQAKADGFVCPITGETLPCPKCCPLSK